MQTTRLPLPLPTPRHWTARLTDPWIDAWRAWCDRPRPTRLRDLDARALADLGLDASELSSVRAEADGQATTTRLRITWRGMHHG